MSNQCSSRWPRGRIISTSIRCSHLTLADCDDSRYLVIPPSCPSRTTTCLLLLAQQTSWKSSILRALPISLSGESWPLRTRRETRSEYLSTAHGRIAIVEALNPDLPATVNMSATPSAPILGYEPCLSHCLLCAQISSPVKT